MAKSMQMYPCPHCAAQFDTFKTLEHHLAAMHDPALSSDSYRCVTCDAEFMAQAEWLDHVRDTHTDANDDAD